MYDLTYERSTIMLHLTIFLVKTKYGEEFTLSDENSDSSSEDDDVGEELTEDVEKQFFKTLSCLKAKDPRIYDQKTNFFEGKEDAKNESTKRKAKKDQPMYIKDYERKILLENGGHVSESEDEDKTPRYCFKLKTYCHYIEKHLFHIIITLL